jgi:hypothetical protein
MTQQQSTGTSQSLFRATRSTTPASPFTPSVRIPIPTVLLLFLWLAPCGTSTAADFEHSQRKGDVEFRLFLTTDPAAEEASKLPAVRLSGELLTLEITGPARLEVTAADGLIKARGCVITRIKPDETTSVAPNRKKWIRRYRLEPERPGPATVQFGALQARYDGAAQTQVWPPLAVNVVTSVQRVSRDELREDLPLPAYDLGDPHWFTLPAWGAAAALTLGFAGIVAIRIRRALRNRQEDPGHWLHRRIGELQRQHDHDPDSIAQFYSELADLFRRYMERRFAVPAPTRTTREFLGDLESGNLLDENQRAILEQFLIRCDLVKFARQAPSEADYDSAVQLVLQFVDQCSRKLSEATK